MVPADSAAFLRLSDGKVLGVAKPAKKERRLYRGDGSAGDLGEGGQAATTTQRAVDDASRRRGM